MQVIADKAGCNKAMLHYYFRNKQQLFEAVFLQVFQKFAPEKSAEIYARQFQQLRANIAYLENLRPDGRYNQLSLDLRLRQLRLIQNWMNEIKDEFHIPEIDLP